MFSKDLYPIGGGGGVNLSWPYVHCDIYIYMKLMWCNGFPKTYAQLEEGDGVNLPWVCALCYIYDLFGLMFSKDLCSIGGGGGGQSAMGICALCYIYIYIYMKLIWCNVFPEIYG